MTPEPRTRPVNAPSTSLRPLPSCGGFPKVLMSRAGFRPRSTEGPGPVSYHANCDYLNTYRIFLGGIMVAALSLLCDGYLRGRLQLPIGVDN